MLICTPDKDLSQCVVGTRVVQLDRRCDIMRDKAGIVAKFGVSPQSIPDYLAVVGHTAAGYPGIPGSGVKAAALTLGQHRHFEGIPKDWQKWHASIRKARLLCESLFKAWDDALLFRTLLPCGWMCRSLLRSRIFGGRDHGPRSRSTAEE